MDQITPDNVISGIFANIDENIQISTAQQIAIGETLTVSLRILKDINVNILNISNEQSIYRENNIDTQMRRLGLL